MLRVDSVVVENIDLGKIGFDYNDKDAVIAVGLGVADLKAAPLRAHLRHALAQPTASITLAPTEVAPLLKRLNAPLSIEGVKASLAINLLIKGKLLDAPIRGRAAIRLEGWIPPHPPEIDGFVFGKVTTIDSAFDVDGRSQAGHAQRNQARSRKLQARRRRHDDPQRRLLGDPAWF